MDWVMVLISYGLAVCLIGGAILGWTALALVVARDVFFYRLPDLPFLQRQRLPSRVGRSRQPQM